MYDIINSETFKKWLKKLKDLKARQKVIVRLEKIREGYFGNYKRIDSKISEIKINYGPGYRIYFTIKNNKIVILLCAGNKGTQKRDIEMARNIIKDWEIIDG
ncbi:MAG: type II toxin-antitoxin system RelE/ParE family toxin [Bacteroidota bacterium]|nr:type II toxin-antitoxin system RelE/ParE family toxin [Bacteroidota bacterium]